MFWFVLIPGALVPYPLARDVLQQAQAPWLASKLKRGAVLADERSNAHGALHWRWLWWRFGEGDEGEEPITAPYAWRALQVDSANDGAVCWHIDPVHFAFARDHMIVRSLHDQAPAEAESQALAAEARAALQEFAPDAQLTTASATEWFLHTNESWQLHAMPLDAALGQSVHHCLPEGEHAARWRKLLTEIQMRWHQHPVNEQREAQGKRAINGLWLHGGGAWKQLTPPQEERFGAVLSSNATLRGWALAATPVACHPREGGDPVTFQTPLDPRLRGDDVVTSANEHALSYLPYLLEPFCFEAWGLWLEQLKRVDAELQSIEQRARQSGFSGIRLVLTGAHTLRTLELTPRDGLRFWRQHALHALLSEAVE